MPWENTQLGGSLVAGCPQGIVAFVISSRVAVDPVLGYLHRPVRRRQRQVPEPRLPFAGMDLEVFDQLVRVEARREPAIRQLGGFAVFQGRVMALVEGRIAWKHAGSEVIVASLDQRERSVESARGRAVLGDNAKVPFAGHEGLVTCRAEPLGKAGNIVPHGIVERLNSGFEGGGARHQQGPGMRASGSGVKVGEAQALHRERIQIRRRDFAAEEPDVGITEIVGKNQQDVGAVVGRRRGRRCFRSRLRRLGAVRGTASQERKEQNDRQAT